MLEFAKSHGLEGVVAKRSDSVYQPGQRTGLWSKYRINLGQEFVIGGYVPSHLGVDSLVVGFYRGKDLIYAARVRAGLVPATRREVFERIKHLKTPKCPFAKLPELTAGRWGQGLTAQKMEECIWLRPEIVAQIQFLEWTGADHLTLLRAVSCGGGCLAACAAIAWICERVTSRANWFASVIEENARHGIAMAVVLFICSLLAWFFRHAFHGPSSEQSRVDAYGK
jgi:ATP dependent DNA ligase C terminal region